MSSRRGLRQGIAASRYARLAALPGRFGHVARANGQLLKASGTWLAHSRERTNFTYDLTPLNRLHLAWWVASATGAPVSTIREYISEIDNDDELRAHIREATLGSDRRGFADPDARYGRRLGWYALVRAVQPDLVVETGTDKGLGSCVFAAALIRNGHGRLRTIDINEQSGFLISGKYAEVIDRSIGDSVALLKADPRPVDIFIHDSLHTYEHELAEYDSLTLAHSAVVLSDNAENTAALPDWAETNHRQFTFFAEQPDSHWYSGSGIGAALGRPDAQ